MRRRPSLRVSFFRGLGKANMTIAEQLRALVTQIADLQKTAGATWETQVELTKAAEVLVREARRLDAIPADLRCFLDGERGSP